jgi:hypothetical protein
MKRLEEGRFRIPWHLQLEQAVNLFEQRFAAAFTHGWNYESRE